MSLASSPNYVDPCLRKTSDSLESVWLGASDFGECYTRGSDSLSYPCLIPVYNGEVLDIRPDFVHASLSGISIKHYYGNCIQEVDEEDDEFFKGGQQAENYGIGLDLFGEYYRESIPSQESIPPAEFVFNQNYTPSETETSSNGSFEYRDEVVVEGQPLCTVPRINHRNSFWNIHRPELCKLTWGQNYVGSSTVVQHLHEHLMSHGTLCLNFHTEEDREKLLNTELDEYVRLKVLAGPRELPAEEPIIPLHDYARSFKTLPKNPKCKTNGKSERKPIREPSLRFTRLNDDEEEMEGKIVRRSKEEFCITIGKHIRKPPVSYVPSVVGEDYIYGEIPFGPPEEARGKFYFDWYLYHGEESYGEGSERKGKTDSEDSDLESLAEPCPPLIMDEFCRAAGKVDLSDLRCNPDDF